MNLMTFPMALAMTGLILAATATAEQADSVAKLSDDLPNLLAAHPDLHRVLADGTFDSMSVEEQVEFALMAELTITINRSTVGEDRWSAIEDRVREQASLEAEMLEAVEPGTRERAQAENRLRAKIYKALRLADELTNPSLPIPQVAYAWKDYWYLYSDTHCTSFISGYPAGLIGDPCPACTAIGKEGKAVKAVMAVEVWESPGVLGRCYDCSVSCPTDMIGYSSSPLDQVPSEILNR